MIKFCKIWQQNPFKFFSLFSKNIVQNKYIFCQFLLYQICVLAINFEEKIKWKFKNFFPIRAFADAIANAIFFDQKKCTNIRVKLFLNFDFLGFLTKKDA